MSAQRDPNQERISLTAEDLRPLLNALRRKRIKRIAMRIVNKPYPRVYGAWVGLTNDEAEWVFIKAINNAHLSLAADRRAIQELAGKRDFRQYIADLTQRLVKVATAKE